MSDKNSHHIEQLWSLWKNSRDEDAANKLIQHYIEIVDFHVERFASYIPDSFDRNDLYSLGLMGLYDALNKFEPDRNLKFVTYATIRIRGAILDGLRKEDWLPRTLRDQSKKIEEESIQLEQKLGRQPTSSEIGDKLKMSSSEVESVMVNNIVSNVLSVDATVQTNDSEDEVTLLASIEDEQSTSPEGLMIDSEIYHDLVEGIKQLNENEQIVISLFYNEELTLTEIGKVLNLTTSRISQIHKRAIFKLRNILSDLNTTYAR